MSLSSQPQARNWGPRTRQGAVVKGHPMTARFLESWRAQGRSSEITGTIYRDALGRTRKDSTIIEQDAQESSGTLRVITIFDPAQGTAYLLHPAEMKAVAMTFGHQGGKSEWFFPGRISEEMANETIAGIECRHLRVSTETIAGAFGPMDIWLSDAIRSVVEERLQTPDEEYSWRLIEFKAGDPDASLFDIPPDYRIMSAQK